MTYNFDPQRWFEDRRALLDVRLERGEMDPGEHARALEELHERYERMVARLDGTYRIPGGGDGSPG